MRQCLKKIGTEVIHIDYTKVYDDYDKIPKDTAETNGSNIQFKTDGEFNAENVVHLGNNRKPQIQDKDEKTVVDIANKIEHLENTVKDNIAKSESHSEQAITEAPVTKKEEVSSSTATALIAPSPTPEFLPNQEETTSKSPEEITTLIQLVSEAENDVVDDTIEEIFETIFEEQEHRTPSKLTKPKNIRKVRVPRKLHNSQLAKPQPVPEKKYQPVHRGENVRFVYKSEGFVPEYAPSY